MNTIKRTAEFDRWMETLADRLTVIRLNRRLDKASRGLLGDVKPVGGDVLEMREFFGHGFRMYYTRRGDTLIVLLGGGDKSTQAADIEATIALSQTLED